MCLKVTLRLYLLYFINMFHLWEFLENIVSNLWITPKKVTAIRTIWNYQFSWVQLFSCVRLFATPWTAACQASLSVTNSRSLLKLLSIKSAMPSNQLILCHPLLLLPSIFPSIRVFSNESVLCIRWPKHWSFSISPSNEYSGLISFGIGWLVGYPCCPRDP